MNEILQQRIESVRAGKNITHAQIEAKRSLREQLDGDLEAFLKNGGAVEQLPQGFSGECSKGWNARQGEIDQLKAQLNNMEQCYIEKKKECEDQHKKVDEVLEYLDGESANRWGLWKEKADMLDQGASNAFEEAYWMAKKALRGEE